MKNKLLSKLSLQQKLNDLQKVQTYLLLSKTFFNQFDDIAFNLTKSDSERLKDLQNLYLDFQKEIPKL